MALRSENLYTGFLPADQSTLDSWNTTYAKNGISVESDFSTYLMYKCSRNATISRGFTNFFSNFEVGKKYVLKMNFSHDTRVVLQYTAPTTVTIAEQTSKSIVLPFTFEEGYTKMSVKINVDEAMDLIVTNVGIYEITPAQIIN